MSTEKKIHEILKGRNPEKREQMVKKISAMEKERLSKLEAENPAPARKKIAPWKIWVPAVSGATVVALSVALSFLLTPKSPEDEFRFCSDEDYKIVEVTTTIKDYALQEGKELLYFDWYAATDYCFNELYQLNDTNETICIREAITDINTGCLVDIYITDTKTEIEILNSYKKADEKKEINDIEVGWFYRTEKAYAHFEYKEYKYYLRVVEPIDENHILDLVAELLPDA